jgi:hypothetical protein
LDGFGRWKEIRSTCCRRLWNYSSDWTSLGSGW